jgi:ribosome-binding factor A
MPTRRQAKVSRVVKEAVSEAILSHLNDPRIEGIVSVTGVEMSPDLRRADVYLSILGKDEASSNKTYIAVNHARSKIQRFLGERIQSKFCPVLRFHKDEKLKKTLETMRLIEQATNELKEKYSIDGEVESE